MWRRIQRGMGGARGRLTAVVLVAAVCLGSAACGGSSEGDADGETGQTTSPPTNREALRAFEREMDDLLAREAYRRARRDSVQKVIEAETLEDTSLHRPEILRRLYAGRNFRPVWYRGYDEAFRPRPAVEALTDRLLAAVRSHGMWPAKVHLSEVRNLGERESRCCTPLDRVLAGEQREAIVEFLADRDRDLRPENFDWLARLLAHDSGPTPELAEAVERRADELRTEVRDRARREVLATDALAAYLAEMRYANPVWHQPRAWRATLRIGERGPVRSTTLAGKQKEKTAAEQMRRAVRAARERTMIVEQLRGVVAEPASVTETMDEAVPPFRQYRRLTEAFRRYRPIVERGGWPELPTSADGLEVGDVSREVRTLKERLRREGYWRPEEAAEPTGESSRSYAAVAAVPSGEVVEEGSSGEPRAPAAGEPDDEYSMVFDERLAEAVTAYQRTHQLWENPALTAETRRSLNVPAQRRWNQIRLALDRWRESNIGADRHYIHVNIPDFHAEVWRDGTREMRFRVVVGKATRTLDDEDDEQSGDEREDDEEDDKDLYPLATPRFSDTLEYMVLNPYWNVPTSIRETELKPKLEENPDYYDEEGFEVVTDDNGFEYLRQKPGDDNALGKVKFLFPNDHSVYMHDTPAKELFDKPMRAYSHGCIRVEKPMELMHYLLDLDGRWSGERRKELLEQWFDSEQEKWLALRETLPVHLEYYVTRVDGRGRAHFLADLYDLDEPRMKTIDARLAAHPDGYDLPTPEMTELMDAALKGELEL